MLEIGSEAMTEKLTHTSDCDWHVDQYLWECTCGAIPKKQAMDNLIAQDADLIDKLRDEDSYYRLQEKHWCIDAEELERQRLAAADRIEALEAENERLREALEKIARLRTDLRGDFSLGSKQSDIARAALEKKQ